jgi:hypothetical protein
MALLYFFFKGLPTVFNLCLNLAVHHHHQQPINIPTAGAQAQAFPMDYT